MTPVRKAKCKVVIAALRHGWEEGEKAEKEYEKGLVGGSVG